MKKRAAVFAILMVSLNAVGQAQSVNADQVSMCTTPTNPPRLTIPIVDCTQNHVIWLDIDFLPGNTSSILGRPTSQFCPLGGGTCQWFGGFTEFVTTGSPGDAQPGLHRYYETCPAGFGQGSVNIHPIVLSSAQGNSCYTFRTDY